MFRLVCFRNARKCTHGVEVCECFWNTNNCCLLVKLTSSGNFVCFQLRLRLYALSICLLEAMLAERNMYRNLGYPSIERLWHIAVAFLIFCALFALGYSSIFVPFAAVESLQFCFCTYETAFHVELQSSFFADASSSQWLIDSGASKHMCFDRGSFDQNTFVSGTPLGVSGVVMGNGSYATVVGTGQVTITTCIGKKL